MYKNKGLLSYVYIYKCNSYSNDYFWEQVDGNENTYLSHMHFTRGIFSGKRLSLWSSMSCAQGHRDLSSLGSVLLSRLACWRKPGNSSHWAFWVKNKIIICKNILHKMCLCLNISNLKHYKYSCTDFKLGIVLAVYKIYYNNTFTYIFNWNLGTH